MAKRSRNLNNEGSKKYMPDGRVTFKIMVGKRDDGKPKMLQVYQRKGETPKETKERFEEELRKYRLANELSSSLEMFDLMREGGDALLGEYLKQYIKDFKEATVKPTTLAYYYNLLNSYIEPYIGKSKIKSLRPIVLQNLLMELAKQNLSYRTLKGVVQFLKAALAEAVYNELIEKNPAENLKIPIQNKKKSISVFTREEQQIFMQAIRGSLYELFFTMGITTGMRCGEMLALKWENVDMEGRLITVNENLTISYTKESGSEIHMGTPKSETSIRVLPIAQRLYELLIEEQKIHMNLFGEVDGFVFKTNNNTPYHSRGHFGRELKRICAENGLPDMNLHGLRHTFATRGLEKGILPRIMQKLLGHSDWQLFFNTYSHVMPDIYSAESAKLVDAIDKINSPGEL